MRSHNVTMLKRPLEPMVVEQVNKILCRGNWQGNHTRIRQVLLSSLARGADTIAAEAALARPAWTVVAPLPFSEANYLEDFEPRDAEVRRHARA